MAARMLMLASLFGSVAAQTTATAEALNVVATEAAETAVAAEPTPTPVWVGCFDNGGADRIAPVGSDWGSPEMGDSHTNMAGCTTRALAQGWKGFGMEYPQGVDEPGEAQCLPLSLMPPTQTQVADADCEVEMHNGFRLGGA